MSNYNNNSGKSHHWKRITEQFDFIELSEVKDHLNLFDGDTLSDQYLEGITMTACAIAEAYVGDFFVDTSIELYAPAFGDVVLPHRGAKSITSITYLDADDVVQTYLDTEYYLDLTSREPQVIFLAGSSRPTLSKRNNPVTVTYVTKLGDIDIEDIRAEPWGGNDIKHAVLMYCSELFMNRDNTTEGSVNKLPMCSERLLAKYRRVVM